MKRRSAKPKIESKAKNIIRANGNRVSKLRRLFERLSLKELRLAAKIVHESPDLENFVTLHREKNDSRIYNYFIPDSSLERSVYWSLGVFKNNIDALEYFCVKEREISDLIIREHFDEALSVLDLVDLKCGTSSWSNSTRASILMELDRLSDINDLYSQVTDGLYQHNMYEAISRQLLFKNYLDESVKESRSRIERQLRNTFADNLYYFLRYKLLTFIPSETYDFKHIFDYEKNSTLIDLFVCATDFVVYGTLRDDALHQDLSAEIIRNLTKPLKTSIFHKLSDSYGLNTSWDISEFDSALLNEYTIGSYEQCVVNVTNRAGELSFSAIEIAAKALCRCDVKLDDRYLKSLLSNLKDYLLKSSKYTKAQNKLHRQATNFRSLNFYKQLNLFLNYSESQGDEIYHQKLKKLIFLSSDINSPFRADFIGASSVEPYLRNINCQNEEATTALFNMYKETIPFDDPSLENVDIERKESYYSKVLIKKRLFNQVIPTLKKLHKSSDPLTKLDASSELINALIENQEDKQAINIFNRLVMENRNYIHNLDSNRVVLAAERNLKVKPIVSDMVALSLYCRYIDSSKTPTLRAAFNKLMKVKGYVSPLDMLNIKNLQAKNAQELIYLLNHIATPEIMKFHPLLKTPDDIDKCRVEICNFLIAKGVSKEEKIAEVKGITKRLVLREATLQVAKTKVRADLSGLKAGSNESHYLLFERYIAARKAHISSFDENYSLYKTISAFDLGKVGYKIYSTSSAFFNELSNLFIKLVKTVIEEFAFGEKGLNANVSTSIRHGHLPNTIRRSLLDEKLTTSRSKTTKVVRPNNFWITKLANESNTEQIAKIFANFTLNLEDLIHKINEEILQVSTLEPNLTGLSKSIGAFFEYSPSNHEMILLQGKIDADCSYAEFISTIEAWLWEKTEENLGRIRDYIENSLSPDIVNTLQNELSKQAIEQHKYYEFTNAAARAKSGLAQNVKTIETWFTKGVMSSTKSFELETAAQIASKALVLGIELQCDKSISLRGDTLSSFVDILYILYENSISKSGLEKNAMDYKHSASLIDNTLTITYENECAQYESASEQNLKIKEFKDSYGDEKLMIERLHSEGGTGFAKIWKIISKDLNCQHELNFEFNDENYFVVEIKIKSNGLIFNENTAS
jgi:hypothetical protein